MAVAALSPWAAAVELTRGPYVQQTTPVSAVLVWRTADAMEPRVRFGPAPDLLSEAVPAVDVVAKVSPQSDAPPGIPRLHSAPADTYQFEAYLTGLEPDTVVYYGIYDGDTLLAGGDADHYLRPAPEPAGPGEDGRPLRLWVLGDSGSGSILQQAVYLGAMAYVEDSGRPIDAFVHLGDLAYNSGTDPEFQAHFFGIYADLMRNTVTWPTMGNHEGRTSSGVTTTGPYYDAFVLPTNGEAGGVPSGTEAFYSFDIGPVHFVCLDSHDLDRSPAGAMVSWLEQDLASHSAGWVVAFWHHPPYTMGSYDSNLSGQLVEMRTHVMPVLEAHGVDVVLAGHSHIYERSMLVDGAYGTPTRAEGAVFDDGDGDPAGHGAYRKALSAHPHDGTLLVVAGHGRGVFGRRGFHPLMRKSFASGGSVVVDVEEDTLTVREVGVTGAVRDFCQIVKSGGPVARQPVDYPWSPHGPQFQQETRRPGEVEVRIIPRPDAPDATVYFTTDGSTPTLDSPVYNGPLVFTGRTTVNAFSVWRGGERISPTATFLSGSPAQEWRLSLPVAAGADDAVEAADGTVTSGGFWLGGSDGAATVGLRFGAVPAPASGVLLGAYVQFVSAMPSGVGAQSEVTLYGELSPRPLPFVDELGNLTSRPLTGASAAWVPGPWATLGLAGPAQRTPSLAAVLEEVIAQPGWESGDPVAIIAKGLTAHQAEAFEAQGAGAARLELWWATADLLTLAAGQPLAVTPLPPSEPGLLDRAEVTVTRPTRSGDFGLHYTIEASADLAPESWRPVAVESATVLSDDGFWEVVRFVVSGFEGFGPRHHFRLHVRLDPGGVG